MVRVMVGATQIGLMQPVWFEFKPNLWMKLDVRDMLHRRILLSSEWDPDVTQVIMDGLSPGMVFVDIGAHAGYFTLLAAERVGPNGRVVCVEPNPLLVEQLRQNVQRSGFSNVTAVQAACSAVLETRDLYLSPFPLSVKSSLSRQNAGTSDCVPVKCITADLLCEEHGLSRVDVMKIDVEGAEMEVLASMANILSKMQPRIVIELRSGLLKNFSATAEDAIKFLESFDYRVSAVVGPDNDNYVFLPVTARPATGRSARPS